MSRELPPLLKGLKVASRTVPRQGSKRGQPDVDVTAFRQHFAASIARRGDLTASGHVDTLEHSVAGSGDRKLVDLESRDGEDPASPVSGDARVNSTLVWRSITRPKRRRV